MVQKITPTMHCLSAFMPYSIVNLRLSNSIFCFRVCFPKEFSGINSSMPRTSFEPPTTTEIKAVKGFILYARAKFVLTPRRQALLPSWPI
jgi:hypothetical protein